MKPESKTLACYEDFTVCKSYKRPGLYIKKDDTCYDYQFATIPGCDKFNEETDYIYFLSRIQFCVAMKDESNSESSEYSYHTYVANSPTDSSYESLTLEPQAQVETNLKRVHQLMKSFDNAKLYIETF